MIKSEYPTADYTWTGTDADGRKMSFKFHGKADGKLQSAAGGHQRHKGGHSADIELVSL